MTSIFDRDIIRKNCEEFFSLYSFTKGQTSSMCSNKITHTRHVAENCTALAKYMGLDEYDCDMAWVIGELHDFARFGQAVATKTFRDSDRFNHAKLGARILFVHGMIEDIIPNYSDIPEQDRTVMYKAVYYHSDFALPDGLTDRERIFCEIIRDADKLDIFRNSLYGGWKATCGYTEEEIFSSDISPKVEEAFFRHETVNNSDIAFPADSHLRHIAMCFGLVSEAARNRAVEQGYLHRLMEHDFTRPDVQERYEKMKAQVIEFLGL